MRMFFVRHLYTAWSLTGLRELERGRYDSVTRLAHAKRIARKDEARHEFRASTSETFEFEFQFELLRLSTRLDCIILSILSMPKKLYFSNAARHEWACKLFLTNISWDRDFHSTCDSNLFNSNFNLLIREK